uniref:Uncharacterized protein n=1 Tax=viral metagenome TaxID=1070528 RepID=A0A6C0DY51_9ZZZZ
MNSWVDLKLIEIKDALSNNDDSVLAKQKLTDISLIIENILSEANRIHQEIDNNNNTEDLDTLEKEKEQNEEDLYKAQNILNKVKNGLDKIKETRKKNKKLLTFLFHLKYILMNNLKSYFYENITDCDIIDIFTDYHHKHNIIDMIETISLLHNTMEFYSDKYLWMMFSDFADFVNYRDNLISYDNKDLIHVFNEEKLNKIKLISCAKYINSNNSINIGSMNIQETTKKYLNWLCVSLTIDDFDISNFLRHIDENELTIIENICIEHHKLVFSHLVY